jgi:tetratricopeptide (TPR) repeat protein
LREPLVKHHPDNLDYRQELVWTLNFEGRALLLKGRLDDALAAFRQAIVHQQHTVRTAPQVPEYSKHLRGHYDDLIKHLKDAKRSDEAFQALREAQAFLEAVSRDHSDIFDLQEYLARMLVQSAQDLRGLGRAKDALTDLARARDIFARLTEQQPKKVLQGYAHCHFQIGLAHGALENGLAEQIRQYEIACKLQYDYLDKFGDHAQPNSSLATFLHNLGTAHSRAGNHTAAEAALRKAVLHHRKALDDPNSRLVGVRQQLNGHYRALVDVLLKVDKTADAVTMTLERQQLWSKQSDVIFSVACDLGRCAAAVNGNNAERERIAGMALQALRQAAAAGFRDWKEMERHPDLASVRPLPGYQALLQEYKK